MTLPASRIFTGLAGLALLTCLAILFLPESGAEQLEQAGPSVENERTAEEGPRLIPESPTPSVATPGVQEEPGRRTREPDDERVKFDPSLAGLSVKVTDSDGKAIGGAEVIVLDAPERGDYRSYYGVIGRLVHDPDEAVASAITNAEGVAALGNLALHSEFLALISAEGMASTEPSFVTEGAGSVIELGPLPLGPGALIEIEIVKEDGSPVVGSLIELHADPIPTHYSTVYPPISEAVARTGEDGIARIVQLPQIPGFRYAFSGAVLAGETKFEVIGVADESGGRMRIVVAEPEWADGRVVDTDGKPVANAQITLRRLQRWDTEDGLTEEQLRGSSPSGLWGSHTYLSQFTSEIWTDAEGSFRAPIPHVNRFDQAQGELPNLISATALIGEDLGVMGKWSPPDEKVEVIVPATYEVTGQVLFAEGVQLPGTQVAFHERPGPGEANPRREERDYSIRFDSTPGPCDSQGRFTKRLLPGHYWLEVLVPGGRHRFPGPYTVGAPLDVGSIQVQPGRTVRIIVKPQDPALTLRDLEAERSETPSDDQDLGALGDLGSLFGRDKQADDRPWQDRDGRWSRTRSDAEIDRATAIWRNEPDGAWRYLLQAPGFVPAVIDLELDAGQGNQELEVPMEATGQVRIQVVQRSGDPASGITIYMSPAADTPPHPLQEELQRTRGYYEDAEHSAQPNPNGMVYFRDVFPGEYEIISFEGESDRSFFAPDKIAGRPVLAKFVVCAGQTTEVEASLATMAELSVMVMQKGQIISGAEVFAVPLEDDPWKKGRVLDPDPSGKTGPDGTLLIPSLTPGKTHVIGARLATDSLSWRSREAWTTEEVMIGIGNQSAMIELSTGGVRLKVSGRDLPGAIHVTIMAVVASTEIPSDADEDTRSRLEGWQSYLDLQPAHEGKYRQEVAGRPVNLNDPVEILHLPPGEYRVLAEVDANKRTARVVSSPFRLDGDIHDLGTLTLVEHRPTQIQIEGISALTEEIILDLGLYCFRVGSQTSFESERWIREGLIEDWMLPPGEYELALFFDHKEAARSLPFVVGSEGPTEFTWTLPELKIDQ